MSGPIVLSEKVIAEEKALTKALEAPHVDAAQVVRFLHGGDVGEELRPRLFRHLALGCDVCCGVLEKLREHPEKPQRREELLRVDPIDPIAPSLDRWLNYSKSAAVSLRPAHRYWAEHALDRSFGFCRLLLEETRCTASDFFQAKADEKATEIFEQTRTLLDDETLAELAPRLFAEFRLYALAGLRTYRYVAVGHLDAHDKIRSHLTSRATDAEVTAAILMMGYEPMFGLETVEPILQKLRESPIPGLYAQVLLYRGRKTKDLAMCRAALKEMPKDAAPTLRLSAFDWVAFLALQEGEALEAYRLYQEAAPLYREYGDPTDRARLQASLATCAFSLGDPDTGVRLGTSAIEEYLAAGSWGPALTALAGLEHRLREVGRAAEFTRYERAFARRIRAGIPDEARRPFAKKLARHRDHGRPLPRVYAAFDQEFRVLQGLPRIVRFIVT